MVDAMDRYLDEALAQYAGQDVYPFHMPGHKRRIRVAGMDASMDITEIDGFDNLHAPEGIIAGAMERAAVLYGAGRSFVLVNGSTVGMLAAVFACVPEGGEILIQRGAHRSVYNAAMLRHLSTVYVENSTLDCGLKGNLSTEDVDNLLKTHPNIRAVVITSPSYDGIVDNVDKISDIVHAHGARLIVDEAHGAHFGFHTDFPQTAVRLGADMVVQSLHKTLPAFTQTALLHVNDPALFDGAAEYLRIFETSSPSYPMMAGADACMRLMKEEGEVLLDSLRDHLDYFYDRTKSLRNLRVFDGRGRADIFGWDISRISILGGGYVTGTEICDTLRSRYSIELEMGDLIHGLAIATVADERAGFERLADALADIDAGLSDEGRGAGFAVNVAAPPELPAGAMSLFEAHEAEAEEVSPEEAAGRISAGFICAYPPGSPIVAPGERITHGIMEHIEALRAAQVRITGMDGSVRVVK
ncbi:MAG: aminotransferase class I/II-fold pyridoxal phosphate-dependent enzyme [Eubacterium sp.]|nr:aminotransferase class I/II-fold pyridoxal phosphate-dependent enzyme [Eubacterium sp.]